MSIENLSAVKPVSAQAVKKEENKQEVNKPEKEIKDGGKKLALALTGLAVVGMATTVAVMHSIKKGKAPLESLSLDEFKKIGKFDKGQAFVEGKPYTGVIEVANKNGKFYMEYSDGALKSSTKHKIYVAGDQPTIKGTDGEFCGIPDSRKLYGKRNGTKTIQKQVYLQHSKEGSSPWLTKEKTTIKDGEIVKKRRTFFGELEDTAKRQKDGSWIVTKQVIEPQAGGKYNINTINKNTGEIISSEEHIAIK